MWKQIGFVSIKSQNGSNYSLGNLVEGREKSPMSKGFKRFQPSDHYQNKVTSSTKNLTQNVLKDATKLFRKNQKGQLSIDFSNTSQRFSSLRIKSQENIQQSMIKEPNQEDISFLSGSRKFQNSSPLTPNKQKAIQERIKKRRQITKKLDQIKLQHKVTAKTVKESLKLFQHKMNSIRKQLDNFNLQNANKKIEQNRQLQTEPPISIMVCPIKSPINHDNNENSKILTEYQNYQQNIARLNKQKTSLLHKLINKV